MLYRPLRWGGKVNLGGVVWGQDSEVGEHSGRSALSGQKGGG